MQQVQPRAQDRSLGELFGDLSRELSILVSQEIALARAELSQKVSRMGSGVGLLAAGGAMAYAGLLGVMAALILLLALVIPTWLSALIVGLVFVGIGVLLAQKGRQNLTQTDLTPQRTLETLREDTEWAKQHLP